jgi:MFS family permease
VIGSAVAAATFGTLLGPLLGTFAVAVGTRPAFAVIGATSLFLAGRVLCYPEPAREERGPRVPITELFSSRTFLLGIWLVGLEALTIGATNTLIPLRLSHLGASGVAIGATFLLAAAVSTVLAPIVGRITDRRGPFSPLRIGLVASAIAMALLTLPSSAASLAVFSVLALGAPLSAYLIPAAALATEATERTGIALAVATMMINIAYAIGETVGAPAAASISQATSDAVPLLMIAGLMTLTLLAALVVMRGFQREPTPPSGADGDQPSTGSSVTSRATSAA